MKLFLALQSPQRDQNWDLPVQSATDIQNVAFGPSHPLPASQSGKHNGLASVKSGACSTAGFRPRLGLQRVKSTYYRTATVMAGSPQSADITIAEFISGASDARSDEDASGNCRSTVMMIASICGRVTILRKAITA